MLGNGIEESYNDIMQTNAMVNLYRKCLSFLSCNSFHQCICGVANVEEAFEKAYYSMMGTPYRKGLWLTCAALSYLMY